MELRHLRYFVAVAEEKNITRAASRLFVTQPALSRQIKDLEKSLGVELLIRAPSGLQLSPAGMEFLPLARDVIERSELAALSMRQFAQCRNHSLGVGYIAPTLGSFLGTALQVFSQRHAQVEVQLFELPPSKQIEALREGRLDIALIGSACPELSRDWEIESIYCVPLMAVLPSSHPLAARDMLQLAELKNENFVGLDEANFPGRTEVLRDAAKQAGFTPRFRQSADGLSSLLALVGSGQGVALAPAEVQQLPHPNVVFKTLVKPSLQIDFSAALRKGDTRLNVRALLAEFRAAAKLPASDKISSDSKTHSKSKKSSKKRVRTS
jgi:DNA-binding transcriptional LysR family regulator